MQLSSFLLASLLASSLALASPAATTPHPVQQRDESDRSYPAVNKVPPSDMTPQAWTDAYNDARSKGLIPGLPLSTQSDDGNTHYPQGTNAEEVCSWTRTKCLGPDDISEAPVGEYGISFDDGPTQHTQTLLDFLSKNNQTSTHFFIGSNVVEFQDTLAKAVPSGLVQFALHTWSHRALTTLTDEEIVAELGWNMQVIADCTGHIPNLLRPPQGDADARVRAIAKHVFGLRLAMWNEDSNDWCLDSHGNSSCQDEEESKSYDSMASFMSSVIADKSKGIIMLEHELTEFSVDLFEHSWPQLKAAGWKTLAIPDLGNVYMPWYADAEQKPAQNDTIVPEPSKNDTSPSPAPSGAPPAAVIINSGGAGASRESAPARQGFTDAASGLSAPLSLSVLSFIAAITFMAV